MQKINTTSHQQRITTMKTLESFKAYIKTLSDDDLSAYGAEIEQKMYRARNPQMVLGYAMGIEEITTEINLRK